MKRPLWSSRLPCGDRRCLDPYQSTSWWVSSFGIVHARGHDSRSACSLLLLKSAIAGLRCRRMKTIDSLVGQGVKLRSGLDIRLVLIDRIRTEYRIPLRSFTDRGGLRGSTGAYTKNRPSVPSQHVVEQIRRTNQCLIDTLASINLFLQAP